MYCCGNAPGTGNFLRLPNAACMDNVAVRQPMQCRNIKGHPGCHALPSALAPPSINLRKSIIRSGLAGLVINVLHLDLAHSAGQIRLLCILHST